MVFFKIYFVGICILNGIIVFFVYMIYNLLNFGNLRILVFDVIFINEGNGYNYYVGVFIVLCIGFYVFIWIIRIYDGYYNI